MASLFNRFVSLFTVGLLPTVDNFKSDQFSEILITPVIFDQFQPWHACKREVSVVNALIAES